jgi:hypothetical protein
MCVAVAYLPSIAWAEPPVRLLKGPYLQDLSPTSVEIRAELDTAAPLAVTIALPSADGGGARTVRDPQVATMHIVRIDGLTPSTHYVYSLSAGTTSTKGELTTAPPNGAKDPFTFLVYGDNRTDDAAHAAIVRQMMQTPSDFVVNTGDFVPDGAALSEWQAFFDIEAPLIRDRCVFSSVGNHELMDGAGANYLRYFGPVSDSHGAGQKPKLYGSFRWGDTRFFLLDAMEAFDSGPERAWLDDELSRADSEALSWRIVVLHHSPWSAGPHGGNKRVIQAGIPALLLSHHVDLILAGHDHIYERGFASGLAYVISGGGGAPLYPIDHPIPSTRKAESAHHIVEMTVGADAIGLVAKRDDGSVLDRCGLVKVKGDKAVAREWDCDPPPSAARALAAGSATPPVAGSRCSSANVGAEARASSPSWLATLTLFALAFARRRRLQ